MLYAIEMSKKTISWKFIEDLLEEVGKTSKGLFAELSVAKNTYSNWKIRGAPLNQAAAIAEYIGVSTDYLLQREGAIKNVSLGSESSDLADVIKLLEIYSRLPQEERADLLSHAESIESSILGNRLNKMQ